MLFKLSYYGRKIVTIADPHIRKNDTNMIYEIFKRLENSTGEEDKLLIRDPYKYSFDDDTFVGDCWPGVSVWPDFFQKRVRQIWSSFYAYNSLPLSDLNFHSWIDMNEPSVFDRPELTFPKEVL